MRTLMGHPLEGAHGTPTWLGGAHGTPTWGGAHGTPTWPYRWRPWDTHLAGQISTPMGPTPPSPMRRPWNTHFGGALPMGHPLGVLMGHPRLSMGHPLGRDTRFASPVHRVDVDSRLSDDSPLAYHRCRFKALAGGMPLEFRQSAGHGGKLFTVHGAGGVDFVSPDPGPDPNP